MDKYVSTFFSDTRFGETLSFVVSYQAKVEDKVVGSISYTLSGDNGDNDSPFVLNGGEEFLLTISGESSYTFGYERVSESSPKAYVRLKSGTNEVSTNNLNKIKEITFADAVKKSEGDNPLMYTHQKSFVAEGQTFDFDISYEVYTDEKYGQMKKMAKALARAGRAKVEKDAVQPLLKGFKGASNAIKGRDGL